MNKEILIAILFTIIMIVTPFITVARENKISNNLTDQPNIKELVIQLNVLIKKISQLYGYIPLVDSLCNRIIGILNTIVLFMFCAIFGLFVAIPLAIIMLILFFSGITNTYIGQAIFYTLFLIFFIWDYNCNFITFPVVSLLENLIKPIFTVKNKNDILELYRECPCISN
ncbi:MAG: hypothetical protein AYK22_00445 [Thermoplasmatales archaeon SG8-52-3]|nr:MAG: hypothetical protein AYK22_00445 [Thermoplasmatales archaeon SG8-52-3]